MWHRIVAWFRRGRSSRHRYQAIDPDEIFLDSSNLPQFDRHQFEGRIERPISQRTVFLFGGVFLIILAVFLFKSFSLQIDGGEVYAKRSEQNRLRYTLIFGERGIFTDRRGELLAWNISDASEPSFSKRAFTKRSGLSHLIGFLKYPSKDKYGFYYKVDFEGVDGAEKYLNEYVDPEHGLKIVEIDAKGDIQSESVLKRPKNGVRTELSIDARVSEKFYELIGELSEDRGFEGGAGVLMDVQSGEILALASFPEYRSQVLSDGTDRVAIKRFVDDPRKPFLNRATAGLYTPGSIVKPFIAVGALEEGIITPEKEIVSTGSISIPNPYDASKPTVFKDWKAHGAVDMRAALAVSSDVYFYAIGGGFENQIGLGIANIEKYMRMFGFGREPGGNDFFGAAGTIPNPEWKMKNFGEAWRLGNTYHTTIGQYGFQVTPMQAVRAIATLANGGKLLEPQLTREAGDPVFQVVPVLDSSFQIVREGMRKAVLSGTATGLNIPEVSVAAKTGTAELGTTRRFVNSWVVGFFPYESPRYAFAVIMEKGPRDNTIGALFVTRRLLEWMSVYTPEYLK